MASPFPWQSRRRYSEAAGSIHLSIYEFTNPITEENAYPNAVLVHYHVTTGSLSSGC
jgi:hypothetical protein